ncbi:MAG: hypothetical protein U1E36_03035 [Rickettsiales bacterium]
MKLRFLPVVFSNLSAVILLSGCSDPSTVQRQYVAMRDQCRQSAEAEEGNYTQNQQIDDRDRSAVLASLFSDCMYEMGWTVATPPREGGGGGGGGVIDTARQAPGAQAMQQGTAPEVGNVTLMPSPLPMSPTERPQDAQQPIATQFPASNYQAVPTPATVDKKTTTGGVAVVQPVKEGKMPVGMSVKEKQTAVPPASNSALTPEDQKSILDNLNHPR